MDKERYPPSLGDLSKLYFELKALFFIIIQPEVNAPCEILSKKSFRSFPNQTGQSSSAALPEYNIFPLQKSHYVIG
jgi:hypothetical protein